MLNAANAPATTPPKNNAIGIHGGQARNIESSSSRMNQTPSAGSNTVNVSSSGMIVRCSAVLRRVACGVDARPGIAGRFNDAGFWRGGLFGSGGIFVLILHRERFRNNPRRSRNLSDFCQSICLGRCFSKHRHSVLDYSAKSKSDRPLQREVP